MDQGDKRMVLDFLRRSQPEVPEAKASATGRVVAWAGAGRVAWSPRDTVSLMKTGVSGNPVGFRSVKLIAEAAAALPVICQDVERRYEVHPLLSLLARPNGAQGRGEFLEALFAQLLLSGNGYVEAVSPDGGMPGELHVLRSDRMSLVPGADGWPVAYEYAVGTKKHRFHVQGASPICHVRLFHPQDDHYGLSPMQAAANALDVHNSASRWSKALLDNAARPSGAIVYRGADGAGTMTAEQFERLQAEMESHHQGARNAGRPMLLEGGLDWKPMGFSPSDMEFQKTKDAAARDIALPQGPLPPLYVTIGPEKVRDRSDGSFGGALHDFSVTVTSSAAGYHQAKQAASAVSDALLNGGLSLARGRVGRVQFHRAQAGRSGADRRIEMWFRARLDEDES
jgi:HK97 family phage portal protein